jgi:hypothetical protein
MKEIPSPWSPVASSTVTHPAVHLGQVCPVENGGGVLLWVPWPPRAYKAHAPLLTHWHFDNWLDMLMGILGL